MTQGEKQLLLQDLCARLPYGVKVQCKSKGGILVPVYDMTLNTELLRGFIDGTESLRPYLRPMSSMTEEEKKEFCKIEGRMNFPCEYIKLTFSVDELDWLNKKMFAYRTINGKDMFELGLALKAPEGMYDIKD